MGYSYNWDAWLSLTNKHNRKSQAYSPDDASIVRNFYIEILL